MWHNLLFENISYKKYIYMRPLHLIYTIYVSVTTNHVLITNCNQILAHLSQSADILNTENARVLFLFSALCFEAANFLNGWFEQTSCFAEKDQNL